MSLKGNLMFGYLGPGAANYDYVIFQIQNCISGVMVSVLALSAVDCGFNGMVWYQNNVSEWSDLPADCCFSELPL